VSLPERNDAVKGWFTTRSADSVNRDGSIPGLNCGYNTSAPRDEVDQNRQQLLETLGWEPEQVAFADQVHGHRVRVVDTGGTWPETDGLITTRRGLLLAIQVADCAAVLISDREGRAVAALHAGWRGAVSGIVPEAINEMLHVSGATPEQLVAWISPCISQERFEVGEEVAEQFPEIFVRREGVARPHVDLKGYVRKQLLDAGLETGRIRTDPGCTFNNSGRYYSWRRDRQKAGRMLAMIGLTI